MTSGFRIFVTTLLLVSASAAHAQYGSMHFSYGICFGAALKAGLVQQPRMRYGLWGEANVGMFAALGGLTPGSMTARLQAQFSRDDIAIRLGEHETYIIESTGFVFNPEVCIPLRNRNGNYKIDLLAGIGAHCITGQSMTIHNVNGYIGGTFLDNLADTVASARRLLQPFLTAGIAVRVHPRGSLVLRIRQDMQNAFYSDQTVTFYTAGDAKAVNLSCQATRLLIGCQITLGKLPEDY